MHLVQILLPLYDNTGAAFERAHYTAVRQELTERFGGLTAYVRSPAAGIWKDEDASVNVDDIVIYEVMVDTLDRTWWPDYREILRQRFRQEALVIRSIAIEAL